MAEKIRNMSERMIKDYVDLVMYDKDYFQGMSREECEEIKPILLNRLTIEDPCVFSIFESIKRTVKSIIVMRK